MLVLAADVGFQNEMKIIKKCSGSPQMDQWFVRKWLKCKSLRITSMMIPSEDNSSPDPKDNIRLEM
jgi:hypothetical protein